MGRLLRKSPTSLMRRGEDGLPSRSPGTLRNNVAGLLQRRKDVHFRLSIIFFLTLILKIVKYHYNHEKQIFQYNTTTLVNRICM